MCLLKLLTKIRILIYDSGKLVWHLKLYWKHYAMKKIIIALVFVFSLISFQQAGAQQLRFYYYPKSNVYYDIANHQYIYLNNGTWTTVTTLPSGMIATGRRVV